MFHHRRSAFARHVADMEGRLRALETELERTGRTAGRRAAAGMSAAGDQVGDAIAAAVTEIVDRFRSGRRLAGDEAVRVGNQAVRVGNDALHRIAGEVEHRPLVTLGVAIGLGILIGSVCAGACTGVCATSRPTDRRAKAASTPTQGS